MAAIHVDSCILCAADLAPLIGESRHWRLILNRNQCLLGKCMLVLRRHEEQVYTLTTKEWLELHEQVRQTTEMLTRVFQPDDFNYAFLQNQDRHVHLHIVPRYAGPREWYGMTFHDPDYPDHYTPNVSRILTDQQLDRLVRVLRAAT